jgi:vacuolar protein 8
MSSEIKGLIESLKAPTSTLETKIRVLGALLNHSADPKKQAWIREYGGIVLIVPLLSSDNSNAQLRACGAVLNMSTSEECRLEAKQCGAVGPICKLLSSNNETVAQYAAGALNNLAPDPEVPQLVIENGGIQLLLDLLKKTNNITTLQYTIGAISALSSDEACGIELANCGAVSAVIELLSKNDDPEIMQRGSGSLWNIAIPEQNKKFYKDKNTVETILKLLESGYSELVSNATIIIGAISTDEEIATMVRELNGVEKIIELLAYEDDMELQMNVAMALWNLASIDENRPIIRESGAIDRLIQLLDCGMVDVLEKVSGAISAQAQDSESLIRFRDAGVISKLLPLLSAEDNVDLVLNATVALGALSFDDTAKAEMVELGSIDMLLNILQNHNHSELLEKAAGTLLNLCLHKDAQTQLRENGGIELLVKLLDRQDLSREVLENVAGALWNLTSDNKSKILIRKLGGLKKLLTIIAGGSSENKKDQDDSKDLDTKQVKAEDFTVKNLIVEEKKEESAPVSTIAGRPKKTTLADSDDEKDVTVSPAPTVLKVGRRAVKKTSKLASDSDEEQEKQPAKPTTVKANAAPSSVKSDDNDEGIIKSKTGPQGARPAAKKTSKLNDEVSTMINAIEETDDRKMIEAFDTLKSKLDVEKDFIEKKVNQMRRTGPSGRGRGKVQRLED